MKKSILLKRCTKKFFHILSLTAFYLGLNACIQAHGSRPQNESEVCLSQELIPYSRLQQKSVHNAYQRKEKIPEMLNEGKLRSIEFDIHVGKKSQEKVAGDWYVYHSSTDSKSSINKLSDGLTLLRQFHERNPRHEVITLWMDIKDDFNDAGNRPEDLDRLFQSELSSILLTPGELARSCPAATNMQEAVKSPGCAWPTLKDLRGRIIIVLTETAALDYAPDGEIAVRRLAFIGPRVSKAEELDRYSHAVFFNLDKKTASSTGLPQTVLAKNLISRSWDLNSQSDYEEAAEKGVLHLATNKVDEDKSPWSTSIGNDGCLFTPISGSH